MAQAKTPDTDASAAALQSCIELLASVTGQREENLRRWLDLYYQIRRAHEIETGREKDPRLVRMEDLLPLLQSLLHTMQPKEPEPEPEPEQTEPKKPPAPKKRKEKAPAEKPAEMNGWARYKQIQLARLQQARADGVTLGRIVQASSGTLTENLVINALNATPLKTSDWRRIEKALDKIAEESAQ